MIEECERKRREKIKELEKISPDDHEDKIKILNSFIFPQNEGDYKVIDGKLVLVNWGMVEKSFEAYSPDVINKNTLVDLGLEDDQEGLEDSEDSEDLGVPKEPEKLVEPVIQEGPEQKPQNGVPKKKTIIDRWYQDDWRYWIIGVVIIIVILFFLRNCDEVLFGTGTVTDTSLSGTTEMLGTQGGGGNKGTQGGGGNKGTQGGGGSTGESEREKMVVEKYLLGEIWEIYDEETGIYKKYVKEQNTQSYISLEEYIQTKLPGSI